MAKEYIEREALTNQIRLMPRHSNPAFVLYSLVRRLIFEAPAADVVEVKHGEWKEHFAFGCWHYDCPFCDDGYATIERDETPPNYCQNCGAKMDLKEGAEE